MDFTTYIDPALLVIVPVLWIIGKIIKDSAHIADRHIPLILGAVSVALAVLWVLATSPIAGWQDGIMAAFTAFVQGILCAGLAVYGNQIVKQHRKDE